MQFNCRLPSANKTTNERLAFVLNFDCFTFLQWFRVARPDHVSLFALGSKTVLHASRDTFSSNRKLYFSWGYNKKGYPTGVKRIISSMYQNREKQPTIVSVSDKKRDFLSLNYCDYTKICYLI